MKTQSALLKAREALHRRLRDLLEGDDYGVPGSDFFRCPECECESGAGILNHGIRHEDDCTIGKDFELIADLDTALAEQCAAAEGTAACAQPAAQGEAVAWQSRIYGSASDADWSECTKATFDEGTANDGWYRVGMIGDVRAEFRALYTHPPHPQVPEPPECKRCKGVGESMLECNDTMDPQEAYSMVGTCPDCNGTGVAPEPPSSLTGGQQATFDVESMLRAVVPSGSVCDPQVVADSIREYFAQPPQQARMTVTDELVETACLTLTDALSSEGTWVTHSELQKRICRDGMRAALEAVADQLAGGGK